MVLADSLIHPSQWDWTTTFIALSLPFVLTYVFTSLQSIIAIRSKKDGKSIPRVPYSIPFVGNAIPFLKDPESYLLSLKSRFGYSTPLRLQLGPQKFYLIPDAKLNSAVFKAGRALTSSTGVKLAMENLFGTPEHVMPLYRKDNSGSLGKPLPGSNIEPKNRIFHLQHRVAQKYLSGNSLNLMTERFVAVFSGRLAEKNIGDDWVEFPNLYKFLQNELFISTVTALYGEKIWTANPTLVDDFWDLDSHSATLFKGYPRWMAPAAYGAQKRTLDCIKRWHALARANSSINTISEDDPEWEPYWGAKFMKARQQYMGEVDLLDDTGKAAEDVGLMFAANANAIPMAFWNMYFIFRDPSVAARARDEVDAALLNPSNPSLSSTNPAFSMPKLTSQPLLQSSYAETLRMRMSTMAIRSPEGNDFKLNEWVFPKGVSIGMPSPLTHMDSTMWNTGKDNDRPVKQYWADRFIIDPSNPNNIGPVKNPPPVDEKERPEKRTFSMDGTSGLWVPYGGGIFQCPGRFFAKGEIMAAHALLAAFFDVELMEPDKEPRPNMEYYLMGGVPPMDAVPFRIRKRQRE